MSIVNKEIISSKKQVDEFIHTQENLSLLRFITCGSVDDGKSTLIGRILFGYLILSCNLLINRALHFSLLFCSLVCLIIDFLVGELSTL